jgi:group II intron reverse transcriptase/maturase
LGAARQGSAGRVPSQAVAQGVLPKADGRLRPLGIAALEDKIVQRAVVEVLNAIYETDFLGFSYGFRPSRGPHDALDALDALVVGIERKKVNWVLDADIRDFFTSLDHSWLVRFLEHRIADRRVLRLIQKWLRAGVIEDGAWSASENGSPQGATVSPLLANVYLHYVFDLWAQQWRRRHARGEVIIVRYADDVVLGFQQQSDAERFRKDLAHRLARFGLSLNADKTRLIRFGRFAAQQRAERGLGRPETLEFLGFTHYCAMTKDGRFAVRRRTIAKRMAAKLRETKVLLMQRRHWPIEAQGRWLGAVVRGHLAYYSGPGQYPPSDGLPRPARAALVPGASAPRPATPVGCANSHVGCELGFRGSVAWYGWRLCRPACGGRPGCYPDSPSSRCAAPSDCSCCSRAAMPPRTWRSSSSATSSLSSAARSHDSSWSPPTGHCSPRSAASCRDPAGRASS